MKRFIPFFLVLAILAGLSVSAQEAAKVVPFKKLQEFLLTKAPTGFTATAPKGETTSVMGMQSSTAKIEFTATKKEQLKRNH